MSTDIIGWDIGGAHLKAAWIDTQGQLRQVSMQACPLWQGLPQLSTAVSAVLQAFGLARAIHVVTMTGELVDLFPNRIAGVQQILAHMRSLLPEQPLEVFAGAHVFVAVEQVTAEQVEAIASANWLATAQYVALQVTDGILMDVGSTTTDILLLEQQSVQAIGFTDWQRLQSDELIYTGIIRTPVMAVAQQVLFQGQMQGLMTEYFATMADVYRLTGELDEAHDLTPTADGAEKSVVASARRLSRMTGCDFEAHALPRWQQFAAQLRSLQLQKLGAGVSRQLSRQIAPSTGGCLIGAGVGRFLVRRLAKQMDFSYQDFDAIVPFTGVDSPLCPADCAPAVAVALLFFHKGLARNTE